MSKKPSLVDLPVLMIFFIRPDTFRQVFERVREARPSKLYLCQDGPRPDRPSDVEKINACREIASHIDWECEVHQAYSDVNYGCDPNVYRGLKWVFEKEEYMVMLEDDAVPSLSFFSFAKQMLEKYRDDTRIYMISSFNLAERWPCPNDYFFAYTGTMSGCWAMWKRCWEERDERLALLKDEYAVKLFRRQFAEPHVAKSELRRLNRQRKSILQENKIVSFEAVVDVGRLFNHQLAIVPAKNMLNNIGMTADATHGTATLRHFPRQIQRIFYMKTWEMPATLRHPSCILPDNGYLKRVSKILGWNPVVDFCRKVESRLRRIIFK